MNKLFLATFILIPSLATATVGPIISYVQLSTGATQKGGFNTTTGTVTSGIYLGNGSVSGPAYSWSSSTTTGIYFLGDSSKSMVFVSSVIAIQTTGWVDTDGSHAVAGGIRPQVYIGGVGATPNMLIGQNPTYTQLGEGLNVWGQTDGGGAHPQVDIVANNIGNGDARLLAQSLGGTPNTSIGYVIAYGQGHGGTYWTGGPLQNSTVDFVFQAPNNNLFQMTTSSQTYFWNQNATHAAYHFVHGANPSSDDITFIDGKVILSTAAFNGLTFSHLGPPNTGSMVFCQDCTTTTPASCNANSLASCICASGGTGAFAKSFNGQWYCN